jgi:hypothetical protein
MLTPYPKVSVIHYQDSVGVWKFLIVMAGKEQEKMLELALLGAESQYIAFENCKYLGKV